LAIKRIPAIFTLSFGIFAGIITSFFVQDSYGPSKILSLLFSGYESDTGVEVIDSLLSRGGIESMFFSISIVLVVLGLGIVLFKFGIWSALLDGIQDLVTCVSVRI